MLRLPAVAGRFYPSEPSDLRDVVRRFLQPASSSPPPKPVKACFVPHAGYMYSGHVAGAVFTRIAIPTTVIILGVRHHPHGERAAILSTGAWRTPLGDAPIDEGVAAELCLACPLLKEDGVAHSAEHSLEVQLPFLQVLAPSFHFVPIALGTIRYDELASIGQGIGRVLAAHGNTVLLLTSSDLNHYEDDATTRVKDHKAINRLLNLDPNGLYDVCHSDDISMCGLGPAVAMLTALKTLGPTHPELVRYATSADISGDPSAVVGYAGLIFS
jgi:MEMO1 family protein